MACFLSTGQKPFFRAVGTCSLAILAAFGAYRWGDGAVWAADPIEIDISTVINTADLSQKTLVNTVTTNADNNIAVIDMGDNEIEIGGSNNAQAFNIGELSGSATIYIDSNSYVGGFINDNEVYLNGGGTVHHSKALTLILGARPDDFDNDNEMVSVSLLVNGDINGGDASGDACQGANRQRGGELIFQAAHGLDEDGFSAEQYLEFWKTDTDCVKLGKLAFIGGNAGV